MVLSVGKVWRRIKVIALFFLLTFILYRMLAVWEEWMRPADPYREPTGQAAKVFRQEAEREERWTMAERLKRFYWYGE